MAEDKIDLEEYRRLLDTLQKITRARNEEIDRVISLIKTAIITTENHETKEVLVELARKVLNL